MMLIALLRSVHAGVWTAERLNRWAFHAFHTRSVLFTMSAHKLSGSLLGGLRPTHKQYIACEPQVYELT